MTLSRVENGESIFDIAKKLGVAASSVYRYFGKSTIESGFSYSPETIKQINEDNLCYAATHSTQSMVTVPQIEEYALHVSGAPTHIEEFDEATYDKMARALMKRLNPPEVIVKCAACGQWGAVKMPCRHCGSPIDPEM